MIDQLVKIIAVYRDTDVIARFRVWHLSVAVLVNIISITVTLTRVICGNKTVGLSHRRRLSEMTGGEISHPPLFRPSSPSPAPSLLSLFSSLSCLPPPVFSLFSPSSFTCPCTRS